MKHFIVMFVGMLAFSAINCAEAHGAELCWNETIGAGVYTLTLTHSDFPSSQYVAKSHNLVKDADGVYHFPIPDTSPWSDWNTPKTEMYMFASGVADQKVWIGRVVELIPQEPCSTPGVVPGKPAAIVPGDLNCDGKATIADTLIHLHAVNGLSGMPGICE